MSLPDPPDSDTPHRSNISQPFVPAGEIRELFDAGQVEQAINEARNLYEVRSSLFSSEAQSTVLAFGNLLEYATRARRVLPDLHERLEGLEKDLRKRWEVPALRGKGGVPIENLGDGALHSPGVADMTSKASCYVPSYIMHTVQRLCEYTAQTGRKDSSLRELSVRTLEHLHEIYSFFEGYEEKERLILKQDAASVIIRSAAHIAAWKAQDDKSDISSLTGIAQFGRDKLAEFSGPLAQHNFALFELESGQIESGLKRLEALVESPQGVHVDVRIASLDQLTGWYIRLEKLDSARASLSALREALIRDGDHSSSTMKDNLRVRVEEALRVRSYEKMLSDAGWGSKSDPS